MRLTLKIALAVFIVAAMLGVIYVRRFGQPPHPAGFVTSGLPRDVQTALMGADTFTVFSLDPEFDYYKQSTNAFQRHNILGQLDVKSRETRKELIDALNAGINGAWYGGSADCFNPRDGIRAKKGSETVELIICFQCGQIFITSRWHTNELLMTTGYPARTFFKVLNAADIVVAGQYGVYYVNGEVAHPGPKQYYDYPPGKSPGYLYIFSFKKAIQAAGGFTPAASHKVWLLRHGNRVQVDLDKPHDDTVYPDDQITVPRNNTF